MFASSSFKLFRHNAFFPCPLKHDQANNSHLKPFSEIVIFQKKPTVLLAQVKVEDKQKGVMEVDFCFGEEPSTPLG